MAKRQQYKNVTKNDVTSEASVTSVVDVNVLVVDVELFVDPIDEVVSLEDKRPLVPRSMLTASSVVLR